MTRLLLLTVESCHLCDHARRVLGRLAGEFDLQLDERPWGEEGAARLLRRDAVPFPPALYLGEELWAYGRLSEGRLRRRLKGLGAA